MGIEPMASALPKPRSTTELRRHSNALPSNLKPKLTNSKQAVPVKPRPVDSVLIAAGRLPSIREKLERATGLEPATPSLEG